MFLEIFRFECRYQLRSPLFLVVSGLWFLMAFLVSGTEAVSVGGVGSNLNLNANFAILQIQYTFTVLGLFPAVAFVAGAITRDYEAKTAQLLFSTGTSELSYFFGRFAGGALFATLVGIAGLLGTLIGTFMPWLDPERVGPFTAAPYLFSIWAIILPNLLIISALFFSVAALTRSMMAAYVAALGFFVAYIVVANVTDQETIGLMALFDPFGLTAFGEITRYWTVFDRNFGMPELTSTLLYNRMIWAGISMAVLLLAAWRYRFNLAPAPKLKLRRREKAGRPAPAAHSELLTAHPVQGVGPDLARFFSQLRMDVRGMTRSIPFYVLLAFGMLQVVGSTIAATTQIFGTPVYPLTGTLIAFVGGSFTLAVLIIIIYYSGELVHRERQALVHEIVDATAYPNWIMVLSKVSALWFVIASMLVVVMITAMLVQIFNDYYRFELLLYLKGLFGIIGIFYFLTCVPAVLVQVLSPNKFVGMVVFLAIFLGIQTLPSLDFEHYLYQYAPPPAPYSDMNGYGHFVERFVSFCIYWGAFSGLLIVVAHLFFRRGYPGSTREQLAVARGRWNGAVAGWTTAFAVLFIGTGAWIFYNTNVLNEYVTSDEREQQQADYEKAYKQFEDLPSPALVDLETALDIYPETRRLDTRGSARMVNREQAPIEVLHLTIPLPLTVNSITLTGAELEEADDKHGYHQYRFTEPLAPGAETTLTWDMSWINEGFHNSGGTTRVVKNGTFVNNTEIMPLPGISEGSGTGRQQHPARTRSAASERARRSSVIRRTSEKISSPSVSERRSVPW